MQLEIGGEAGPRQHPADGRGLKHADLQILQRRILEALDVETAVVAVDEHIGRAVDRKRRQRRVVDRRQIEQHIADVGIERLARQTALQIGAPEIFEPRAKCLGQHLGDFVLVAVPFDVRQWHVTRVGTHGKLIERLGLEDLFRGPPGGGLFRRRHLAEGLLQVAGA